MTVCMGFMSTPLLAEEAAASEPAAASAEPVENSAIDHKAEAAVQKGHAEYHKGLALHERSQASVLGNTGKRILMNRHNAIAVKEEALVKEYEKKALAHEQMAKAE